MKNRVHYFTIVLLLFCSFFTACKKYPDGTALSLQSKEKRLCNSWHLTSAKLNQQEKTDSLTSGSIKDFAITINDNGSYKFQYIKRKIEKINGSIRITLSNETETGLWEFSEDKTYLIFDHPRYDYETAQHPILKLTKNQLWLCEYKLNRKRGVMDRIEYHWER